jgi:hypothetical protein
MGYSDNLSMPLKFKVIIVIFDEIIMSVCCIEISTNSQIIFLTNNKLLKNISMHFSYLIILFANLQSKTYSKILL